MRKLIDAILPDTMVGQERRYASTSVTFIAIAIALMFAGITLNAIGHQWLGWYLITIALIPNLIAGAIAGIALYKTLRGTWDD